MIRLATLLPAAGGDGSGGFALNGIDPEDEAGAAAAGAGDVNGDGLADLLIGARGADPGDRSAAGEAYVVFGRASAFAPVLELSSLLPANGGDGSAGFVLNGVRGFDAAGGALGAAGDLNGDGAGDIVVGARTADPRGRPSAGASYVVFGRRVAQVGGFPPVLELASLLPPDGGDGSAGFALHGTSSFGYSGEAVSAAGDLDGDGTADLLVGARGADPGGRFCAGQTFVVFGRPAPAGGAFPPIFPLLSLLAAGGGDGSAGFVLDGIDADDWSGAAVSAAGDVNGDGLADVLVGAYRADPQGRGYAGESYVVFGRSTPPRAGR